MFACSYAVYNIGAAATVIIIEFWLIREVGITDAVLYMGALNSLVALMFSDAVCADSSRHRNGAKTVQFRFYPRCW